MGRAQGRPYAKPYERKQKTRFYKKPRAHAPSAASAEPCAIYTRTGRCDNFKNCRYKHDPKRRALCLQFLKTGRCAKPGGERCFLSHVPRAENTPMCKHFARGRCTKADCAYVHMQNLGPDPSNAPVCRRFALNGWCDSGAKCTKRHSFDCPDFEAHGTCANPSCRLEHVIKAKAPALELAKEPVAKGPGSILEPSISLERFLDFVRSASRQAFDAAVFHSKPSSRIIDASHGDNDDDDENDEDEADDSDSGSESGWEAEEEEPLDVNADFIRV